MVLLIYVRKLRSHKGKVREVKKENSYRKLDLKNEPIKAMYLGHDTAISQRQFPARCKPKTGLQLIRCIACLKQLS